MGVVKNKRIGDDVVYTLAGNLDAAAAHHYFDLNYRDYHEIGDAIGVIIDLRAMERLTVAGLRVAQQRMSGVVFDTPVAFVGNPDSILLAFLSILEGLSSRTRSRFAFFREGEDPIADAVAWVGAWYEQHGIDREARRGRITAAPTPPPASEAG